MAKKKVRKYELFIHCDTQAKTQSYEMRIASLVASKPVLFFVVSTARSLCFMQQLFKIFAASPIGANPYFY